MDSHSKAWPLRSGDEEEQVARATIQKMGMESSGVEIVEDLVELMTFQKLNCGPRSDCEDLVSVHEEDTMIHSDMSSQRARTSSCGARGSTFNGERRSASSTRHSQESSSSDNRRKRSFSMYESDEDDELASLSSNTTHHMSSKHQKLRDEFEDELLLPYLPSDSIYRGASQSSSSMSSSSSSVGEFYASTGASGPRVSIPRVCFPLAGYGASSTVAATPSPSSSRSSPRSGTSSPRNGPPRTTPSVFKRAQSEGEVLIRNSAAPKLDSISMPQLFEFIAPAHTSGFAPNEPLSGISTSASSSASSSACSSGNHRFSLLAASSTVSTNSGFTRSGSSSGGASSFETSVFEVSSIEDSYGSMANTSNAPSSSARAPRRHGLSRHGSGRSVSSSALPTSFRYLPSSSMLRTSQTPLPSTQNQPAPTQSSSQAVNFCAAPPSPLSHPGLIKPIAISPPSRRPRRPTYPESKTPSPFVVPTLSTTPQDSSPSCNS